MSKRKHADTKTLSGSLNEQEKKLYEVILAKRNMGASKIELKAATGILDSVVTRSLNSLRTKNLIRETQNINKRGMRHYLAVEFEPSTEISGGAWYNDGNLDLAFIEELKKFCVRMIKTRGVVTLETICDVICKKNISNENLTEKQIEEILENLMLDKDVMKVTSTGMGEFSSIPVGKVCYKLTRSRNGGDETRRLGAFALTPCGACPQISNCTPNGVISPQTCVYFQKWLDF